MTIDRIKGGPRMSQAVIHNGTVYLAGQVASNSKDGSVAEQTREILKNIDSLLAEAGSHKGQLLTATIWLTDMATFGEMNSVWDSWVVQAATPARATVCSPELAAEGYFIEIAVTAALS
jgi:enamine deaminase RidA (YjgF/YER057c/UK114 family)